MIVVGSHLIAISSGTRDHCCIICTQNWGWEKYRDTTLLAGSTHLAPQGRVTGDPPHHDNSTGLHLYHCTSCFCYQNIDDSLLKTCHDIVALASPLRRRRKRPEHVIVKQLLS